MKKKDLIKALEPLGDDEEVHLLDPEFDLITPVSSVRRETAYADEDGLHTCPAILREKVHAWLIG